jgi:hypothetical protein
MDVSLKLLQWAAWAPGVTTQEAWHAWAHHETSIEQLGQPTLEFIPAMARRRMSRVTRMAIQAAHHCRADKHNIPTVFASRHGEIHRCFSVLETMTAGELVSPADFSVSVHNAAAGLYSIQQQDRSPSTTISAGIDTLEAAFVEAYGQLCGGAHELLLVLADEPVPVAYQEFIDEAEYPYALALHLAKADACGPTLTLQKHTSMTPVTSCADTHPLPHGLQLLRVLCGSGHGQWGHWQWQVST